MADLKDLIGSKKVKEFVRKEKSRPWTMLGVDEPTITDASSPPDAQLISEKTEAKSPAEGQPSTSKPVANGEQTGSKPGAKTGSKPVANGEQTGSNSKLAHSENFPRNKKPVAQPVARRVANQEQTGSKPVAEPSITHVVGHEQKFLLLIFEECRKEGSLTSPPLTKEFISKSLETSHGTVKSVILRLERKELVKRQSCKVGRGGWLQFSLPRELFQKLLLNGNGSKQVANGEQTGSKPVAKPVAQPVADSPSSSSSLDLKKLTTTGETARGSAHLPAEWDAIDSTSLAEQGFTRTHVIQVYEHGKLSAAQLQESIDAFDFDLRENGKAKDIKVSSLNFFMGIVRRGNPYTPPKNYKSSQDQALERFLELAAKRQERIRRALDVAFIEWNSTLSPELKTQFVPPSGFTKVGGSAHTALLKEYFVENVWPDLLCKIQSGDARWTN